MKNTRFLLQVAGLSVLMAGCMSAAPETEEGIYFLQQRETGAPQMEALLEGELVLTEGCLRIQSSYGEESYAAIWPFEFGLSVQSGAVEILNGEGQVVAQVGDHIRISGGGGNLNMSQEAFEKHYLGSYRCSEPHWIVGYEVMVITP